MKNKELISIIVPIYNVEKYLKDCVISIINQIYKNIEIILVDDGSTDNSSKLCDELSKLDNRIKVFHKKNGGLSDSRNYVIDKANGEYITFIDSDDSIESDYVSYLFDLIKKYDVKLSICPYTVVINENKKYELGEKFSEEKLDKQECLKRMLLEKGFTISACAKLYKKELFADIRFPVGKLCEDNGTTYKTILKCDYIAYGCESKYNYFKRPNSIMTSSFNNRKFDLLDLTDAMCNDIENEFPNLSNVCDKKRIHSRFSILRQMINCKLDNTAEEKMNEIIKFLKKQKKKVLLNKEYDKRDKIAMISLIFGKNCFKLSWNIYNKIRN